MKCHITQSKKQENEKGGIIFYTKRCLFRRLQNGIKNIQKHVKRFIQRIIVKELKKNVYGGNQNLLEEKRQLSEKQLVIDVENRGIWLSTTKTEIGRITHTQTCGLYVDPVMHTYMARSVEELTTPHKKVVVSSA